MSLDIYLFSNKYNSIQQFHELNFFWHFILEQVYKPKNLVTTEKTKIVKNYYSPQILA